MNNTGRKARGMNIPALVALALLVIPIAAFSLFVGWNKAFAPLSVLAQHSAWTIHLPVVVGRAIGLLELVAAAILLIALFVPRFSRAGMYAAIWITLNNIVAAIVHVIFAEWHTLPQSAVVITLCTIMVLLFARRARGIATAGR
ncbi:DoxX family protein [Croceicoccus marinus]|uniref:DoxX family protein n=2 Tax=Croceicoccus marinus TaxID=450378 RepID=A0A7G6W0P7_9SPHN|nr:DoxX family protein [Croceicoccus marinus]QNE07562.1 DoxX family protein [Croceicoccus marinus]